MSDRPHTRDLPPMKTIRAGLKRVTETLATELAQPTGDTPEWTELGWRLASAVAAAHGVASQWRAYAHWRNEGWLAFLRSQHEHVALRHQRIDALLERIDAEARTIGLPLVALKGSALHRLGFYQGGERPMADIDLLVSDMDRERAGAMLERLGYVAAFTAWKHRVYKPAEARPVHELGEHRDTPVNIELHTRVQERLPVAVVDITHRIYPHAPAPGINPYPSQGALMSHLLLHAAGNICNRSMRLIHLNDLSVLAAHMTHADWRALCSDGTRESPWWALPPLLLASRYDPGVAPPTVLCELRFACHAPLRLASRHLTLTQVSCSDLWLHAWPGIEWSRSVREAGQYVLRRFRPTAEARQERADMVRTQLWLQGSSWVRTRQLRRVFAWLIQPVPRMDTLYVVRAALAPASAAPAQCTAPAATACR